MSSVAPTSNLSHNPRLFLAAAFIVLYLVQGTDASVMAARAEESADATSTVVAPESRHKRRGLEEGHIIAIILPIAVVFILWMVYLGRTPGACAGRKKALHSDSEEQAGFGKFSTNARMPSQVPPAVVKDGGFPPAYRPLSTDTLPIYQEKGEAWGQGRV